MERVARVVVSLFAPLGELTADAWVKKCVGCCGATKSKKKCGDEEYLAHSVMFCAKIQIK